MAKNANTLAPGDKLSLAVVRNGKNSTVIVTLGAR